MGDHADVAQLVERDLAKVEVAGSSPVVRSKGGFAKTTIGQRNFIGMVDAEHVATV
jgi:hypothetical protein